MSRTPLHAGRPAPQSREGVGVEIYRGRRTFAFAAVCANSGRSCDLFVASGHPLTATWKPRKASESACWLFARSSCASVLQEPERWALKSSLRPAAKTWQARGTFRRICCTAKHVSSRVSRCEAGDPKTAEVEKCKPYSPAASKHS